MLVVLHGVGIHESLVFECCGWCIEAPSTVSKHTAVADVDGVPGHTQHAGTHVRIKASEEVRLVQTVFVCCEDSPRDSEVLAADDCLRGQEDCLRGPDDCLRGCRDKNPQPDQTRPEKLTT